MILGSRSFFDEYLKMQVRSAFASSLSGSVSLHGISTSFPSQISQSTESKNIHTLSFSEFDKVDVGSLEGLLVGKAVLVNWQEEHEWV